MDSIIDNQNHNAIVNRGDPIPVLRIDKLKKDLTDVPEEHEDQGPDEIAQWSGKRRLSQAWNGLSNARHARQAMYDKVFANIMSQVIPVEEKEKGKTVAGQDASSTSQYVDKPGFSLAVMGSNFQRFNSRIGVVFVIQNELTYLFTWRHTSGTLSFLAVWTLVSLNPHLILAVPILCILFFVMAPSFLTRHPQPSNDPRIQSDLSGPPIAPPPTVEPVPELSIDFFRNMRDLQNTMEDFNAGHDAVVDLGTTYFSFSDEKLSSALFLSLSATAVALILGGTLIPWRLVLLIAGWSAIGSGHPRVQEFILHPKNVKEMKKQMSSLSTFLRNWADADITLDAPPETRQVEIYELQKHHAEEDIWEPWLFSATPFDPLSPSRISGARAEGTQFFEEVQPPTGWIWKDKKWSLDLWPREWVERRLITGVEIETAGERWVYDVPTSEIDLLAQTASYGSGGSAEASSSRALSKSGWAEATGLEERGEWRRRRWFRNVQKKVPREIAEPNAT